MRVDKPATGEPISSPNQRITINESNKSQGLRFSFIIDSQAAALLDLDYGK